MSINHYMNLLATEVERCSHNSTASSVSLCYQMLIMFTCVAKRWGPTATVPFRGLLGEKKMLCWKRRDYQSSGRLVVTAQFPCHRLLPRLWALKLPPLVFTFNTDSFTGVEIVDWRGPVGCVSKYRVGCL